MKRKSNPPNKEKTILVAVPVFKSDLIELMNRTGEENYKDAISTIIEEYLISAAIKSYLPEEKDKDNNI